MTIKQDIINFAKTCIKCRSIKNDMNVFSKKNAQICSEHEYWDNYIKTIQFEKKAEMLKCSDCGDLNNQAFANRSTSCFYVGPNERYSMQKCVNVQNDGFIIRNCCSNCSHFKTVKEYSEKAKMLAEAERCQYESINAFLRKFKFWENRKQNKR